MSAARLLLVALAAWLVAACGMAVPAERMNYVGSWRAPGMELDITAKGDVRYRRVKGNQTTSVEAPLKAFHGDDFEVGIGPLTTRFVVSKPPALEGGAWTMTVDGVKLARPARST